MHAHTRQWHEKKSKHSEWTRWDEAKSGRLNLWAAPMIVQLQEATTEYYCYRAVLAIFPLTPDQIRAQIWPNGVRGGGELRNILWKFHFDEGNLWWPWSLTFRAENWHTSYSRWGELTGCASIPSSACHKSLNVHTAQLQAHIDN